MLDLQVALASLRLRGIMMVWHRSGLRRGRGEQRQIVAGNVRPWPSPATFL